MSQRWTGNGSYRSDEVPFFEMVCFDHMIATWNEVWNEDGWTTRHVYIQQVSKKVSLLVIVIEAHLSKAVSHTYCTFYIVVVFGVDTSLVLVGRFLFCTCMHVPYTKATDLEINLSITLTLFCAWNLSFSIKIIFFLFSASLNSRHLSFIVFMQACRKEFVLLPSNKTCWI